MRYSNIVSSRDVTEWICGCPIRITNVSIIKNEDDESRRLSVTSEVCGDLGKLSYTAQVEYKNSRKEKIGEVSELCFDSGVCELDVTDNEGVVYAAVSVQSVSEAGKIIWTNDDGAVPTELPEQEILWQTNPYYDLIRRECSGITDAKYIPDTIDGAWRCACGGVNLEAAGKCGRCGTSREWIKAHFDIDYLEKKKSELVAGEMKEKKREKKRRESTVPHWVKAAGVVFSLILIVTLVVLTFVLFIPQARYNKAVSLADEGKYDEAIALFALLGDFSDSSKMAELTVYKKAQSMTGIDDVYVGDSSRMPWFKITEDGVLSFTKDSYTGSETLIVIPDVFDGVIVRELARNFFMNCSELESVVLSDCIEIIGEQAFYNCTSLTYIEFGAGVNLIKSRAFINCTSLSEIEIPDSVDSIGPRAFNNCISLRKVVLGAGISVVPDYLFSNCESLARVTFVSPITSVGEYAFAECNSFEKVFCRFSESEFSPEILYGNEAFENSTKYFDQ